MTNTVSFQWIVDADSSVHTGQYVPPNSNPTYPPKTEKTRIQWAFDIDVTQHVENFRLPPNETFPPAPNKVGIEWTYSDNDDDFTQWFNTFVNKILIKYDDKYHYFDGTTSQWEVIDESNYDKQLFDSYGMSTSKIIENIDTLPNEFKFIVWTDDVISDSKVMNGDLIPLPQLVYTKILHTSYGNLQHVISNDNSELVESSVSNVRYLLTSDNINWQTWNGTGFEIISPTNYKTYGLTADELSIIDLSQWKHPLINVGVYLEDSIDDSVISKVDNLEIKQLIHSATPELCNVNFYVLNTTARIDVTLEGTVLRAILSDDDLGRVQYRILLNGQPYRHSDANEEGWNQLSPSPYNINVNLYDESIIIPNGKNTVRLEFRDAFGTEDSWEGEFFAKKHKGKFTYAFII